MSQPLGVKVVAGGQPLAVGIWRWGAYTRCAAEIVDGLILDGLGSTKPSPRNCGYNLYRVMRTFERRGGVLADEDDGMTMEFVRKCAKKHGRGHSFRSLKDGDGEFEYYVGDGMFDSFASCCCGHVVVDLDCRTVAFHVFSMHTYEEWSRIPAGSFPKEATLPCNPFAVPLSRWDEFREFVTDKWDMSCEYARVEGEYAIPIC